MKMMICFKLRMILRFQLFAFLGGEVEQESLYHQPKQCTIKQKNPSTKYHRFALFHPPKMGKLMIPFEGDLLSLEFFLKQKAPFAGRKTLFIRQEV